jgi:molybdopterin converting factor small subunit
MLVPVRLTGHLRTLLGAEQVEVDAPVGTTVAEVLARLLAEPRSADIRGLLTAADGGLATALLIAVNDQACPARAIADRYLGPGDRVTLMPPIAGG